VVGRTFGVAMLVFVLLAPAAGAVWAATINGTARNDTLRGGARADKLDGKRGNDKLFGAGGDDVLVGGPGNDLLVGGGGADTLRCGPGRDSATRDLQDKVSADCEVVRGPKPAPLPPPPPAPAPGAAATYVFGPELSSEQQSAVQRGLDAAARHYRSALGRELPPFSVWAHADLESMIRTYASTRPTSLEESRRLWTGGQVGHALPRKLWLGPGWFLQLSGGGYGSRLKIAAHEAFHLLQYEVAPENLWFGGIDDVRPLGPWWLLEGAPEYFGSLAIVEEGVFSLTNVYGQWEQTARSSPATLRSLETFRGQLNTPGAYDIYALAVRQLVRDRDPKLVMTYFEAVGRGASWPNAFLAAFGRTVDAFYAEFESYRRGG
jgi:hypothetical protein